MHKGTNILKIFGVMWLAFFFIGAIALISELSSPVEKVIAPVLMLAAGSIGLLPFRKKKLNYQPKEAIAKDEAQDAQNTAIENLDNIQDSFSMTFRNKADEIHKIAVQCYKNGDYRGFVNNWIEEVYFRNFAFVINGGDHEPDNPIDLLRSDFSLKSNRTYISKSIKNLGKEDQKPLIESALSYFIDDISNDFMMLSQKSTEVYESEIKFSKTYNATEDIKERIALLRARAAEANQSLLPRRDIQLMKDEEFMRIMKKRESKQNLTKIQNEIMEILH